MGTKQDKMDQARKGSMDALKSESCATGEAERKMGSLSSCGNATACDTSQIKDHMDVIASCGTKVGVVDRVESNAIKLTKNDSPDGKHHVIPTAWVDHVDKHVHLKKNSEEAKREWQPA